MSVNGISSHQLTTLVDGEKRNGVGWSRSTLLVRITLEECLFTRAERANILHVNIGAFVKAGYTTWLACGEFDLLADALDEFILSSEKRRWGDRQAVVRQRTAQWIHVQVLTGAVPLRKVSARQVTLQ
jgi:hypothetical protein